ncbi:MAG: hypothetical protein KH366_20510 [Clostridiaceae bacterium]|nr:hypothetical protein [Clostridiaceae bacterium]
MKKQIVLLTAVAFTLSVLVSGCAEKKAVDTTATAAAVTLASSSETEAQKESTASPTEESESHNENMDASELQKFAERIQDLVSKKDLNALAELCDYPLFLNGEEIEDKDAFLKLDAGQFFSDELLKSISDADPSSLEIFGAGAALGGSQTFFINEINGELGITSITTE